MALRQDGFKEKSSKSLMPRQKKFDDSVIKTSALIRDSLHMAVSHVLLDKRVTLSEAINEALILWMAMNQGDRYTHRILAETLEQWRPKYQEERKIEPETGSKVPRRRSAG